MVLSTPLLPAFFDNQKYRCEMEEIDALYDVSHQSLQQPTFNVEIHLATFRKNHWSFKRLLASIGSNQNVSEHFVQILVLVVVIFLSSTKTGIQTGLVTRAGSAVHQRARVHCLHLCRLEHAESGQRPTCIH